MHPGKNGKRCPGRRRKAINLLHAAGQFLQTFMAAAGSVAVIGAAVILSGDALAAGPTPAQSPLGPGIRLNIGTQDRCPVCGMRPVKYPKFACALELADGTTFYFCSAGCLLRTWIHPEIFLSVPVKSLKRAVVQEYFSGRPIDAGAVTWVAGSDVIGPMGPALVPLAGERHLAAFRKRHGGRHTFRLNELTETLWQTIVGRPAQR